AAGAVAAAAAGLSLCADRQPSPLPLGLLRGVRGRWHRLAQRHLRRLPALDRGGRRGGSHRAGRLRPAVLPGHRALADAASAAAAVRRRRRRAPRRRPAAVAGAALSESPVPAGTRARRLSVQMEIGRRHYLAYLLLP